MPIVMCVICNGTGNAKKSEQDLPEQCFYCVGKGQLLQDSSSFPCGGVATESEREEAYGKGLRRA